MVKNNKKKVVKETSSKGPEATARRARSKRNLAKNTLTPKRLMETNNVWNYSPSDMKPKKKKK